MRQHMFIVCFIVSLVCAFLNGSIHHDKFNNDDLNLYKLFQRRTSESFTTAQSEFQKQVLDAHNTYRARHCTPPLILDEDISRSAQKYAELLAQTNILKHSDLPDVGENIFKASSTQTLDKFDGGEATRSWYDEIKYYDFKNAEYLDEAGHFTQVIWKESEKLGVGFAFSRYNSRYILYVVAQYSPAGNVDDYFSENVLPAEC